MPRLPRPGSRGCCDPEAMASYTHDVVRRRWAPAAVALVVIVAGCGGGNDSGDTDGAPGPSSSTGATTSQPGAEFTEVSTTTVAEETEPEREFVDGPLGDVCPEQVVIQLDDAPSVEHGPLYRLLGPDAEIDETGATVAASLQRADGTAEDVRLELRSGGPAVGFRDPIELLVGDPSITLAVASTSDVVSATDALAAVSVLALTDRSHDVIVWDPATHPDVDGISALASTGVEIRYTPSEPFVRFLEASGVLDGATLVDTYLGEPAAFVAADGRIAQQGDALVDPDLFVSLPQWGREVAYGFAADDGWASYDDTLVVRGDEHEDLAACLDLFVPVVQDAMLAHLADPTPANSVISVVRARLNPLTRTSVDLLDAGVERGRADAVLGGGVVAGDDAVGAFDTERLSDFVADLADVLGVPVPEVDDIVTNAHVVADARR